MPMKTISWTLLRLGLCRGLLPIFFLLASCTQRITTEDIKGKWELTNVQDLVPDSVDGKSSYLKIEFTTDHYSTKRNIFPRSSRGSWSLVDSTIVLIGKGELGDVDTARLHITEFGEDKLTLMNSEVDKPLPLKFKRTTN